MKILLISTLLLAVSCGYSPRHDRHESTTITQPECCEDCRTKVKCTEPCKTDCNKQKQSQSQKQKQQQKVIIEVQQPEWDYNPQPVPEPSDQNVDIDIDIDIDNCEPCVKDEPCIIISNDNANTNNNVNTNVNTVNAKNGVEQKQCRG